MPVAPAVAATSGGATRNGSSTSTKRCASGRKRSSQASSQPAFAFRERFRAWLDKHGLVGGETGANQLASLVDLVPDVPVQEPARSPIDVEIGDRPLPVRLLPGLDRLEARVDLADRLIPQVE